MLIHLNQGENYDVTSFKCMQTKYGQKLAIILNNEFKLIVPNNFQNKIIMRYLKKYQIENNVKLILLHNGLDNLPNGFKTHSITFE